MESQSQFEKAWEEVAPSIMPSMVALWDWLTATWNWFTDQKSLALVMVGLVGSTVYLLAGFAEIMFVGWDAKSRRETARSSQPKLMVGLLFYIAFVMPVADDFDSITDIWFVGTTAVCALITIIALFFYK